MDESELADLAKSLESSDEEDITDIFDALHRGITPELIKARESLSLDQRIRLSSLYTFDGGILWLDYGEAFTARIVIDDHSSPEREHRPYAYILFRTGDKTLVETIDILSSVEENSLAIGHPAITAAIRNWQKALYSRHIRVRTNRGDDDPKFKGLKHFLSGRHFEAAERNLKALSEALLNGALKNSVSQKRAAAFILTEMDLENPKNLLRYVWQEFSNWETPDDERGETAKRLLSHINAAEKAHWVRTVHMTPEIVLRFLTDRDSDGGYRFYTKLAKPSWETFRNAFAAWFLGVSVQSVKNYQREAKSDEIDPTKVTEWLPYPAEHTLYRHLSLLLLTAIVRPRLPIVLEGDVTAWGIAEAIASRQTYSKTESK